MKWIRPLPVLVVLLLLGGLSLLSLVPPRPVPDTASKDRFSAARAWAHLEAIAVEPRPAESEANERAREYLVSELEALGYAPRIQASERTRRWRDGSERTFALRNIIVEVPGAEPTGAVLLMSHYDSHPLAPGAGDAGIPVAALLETMRVLADGPPLRNDLVLLLTDGEEYGLLGARSFVESDPAMDRVAIVLNFEGRGSGGPALMFETGPGNRALVRAFHRAVRRPLGSSIFPEAYRFLPNDTDFTVFLQAGVRGLNFANIARAETYHRPTDSPENASPRTLQHHGDQAVATARAFGDMDLAALPGAGSGDAVFFNVAGLGMIRYPAGLAVPHGLLVLALWVGVLVLARRRGALRLRDTAAGFGLAIVALALTVGAAWLVGRVIATHPEAGTLSDKVIVREWPWMLALVGVASAAVTGGIAGLGRWLGATGMAMGALLPLVALGLAAAFLAPGASYLTLWPALLGTAAVWVVTRHGRPPGPRASAIAAALLAPIALLWGPHLALFLIGLTLRMVLVLGAVAGVAALALAPVMALAWRPRRRDVAGGPARAETADAASPALAAVDAAGAAADAR